MSHAHWQKAKAIFNSALELRADARAEYLDAACGGNGSLRRQVEELLASYHTDFLEPTAAALNGDTDIDSRSDVLRPGQKIGRYEVVKLLGIGGMGEVYLARDESLDRPVSLKVFSADAMGRGDHLERFIREAQSASALNHPNICTIYEIDQKHDPPVIAMEYIEGETLADLIHSGKLPLARVVDLAVQVADGLSEAHQASIIHRDIKPANIIVNRRGQAKILDFGLAKKIIVGPEDKTQQQLSVSGMIMGTVSYMSPEQAKSEGLDARSDIFSFGVVLYEMIAGRRPFGGDSAAETMSLILTAEPAPLAPAAPAFLQSVIKKCLEKDPARRYQYMSDVIADMKDLDCKYSDEYPHHPIEEPTVRIMPEPTAQVSIITRWKKMVNLWAVGGLAAVIVAFGAGYLLFVRNSNPTNPAVASSHSPAYDLYVRGKVKVTSVNSDDNGAAIKLLEQAVAIDPNYAEAWAELAKAYVFRSFNFAPDTEKKKLNEDAEVAVEKALQLNPNLAEGHLSRGLVLWTHAKRFPHEQAIQSFKRAIALKPDLDEAHQWLSAVYVHIGLFDAAAEEINKTLEINPNNTTVRLRMVAVNYYQGKYEDAISVSKTTPPDEFPANLYRMTADSLVHLDRLKEADTVVKDYLRNYPEDEGGNVTSLKAILLVKEGKQNEAEAAIQRATEIGKGFGHFHHAAYNIASAYALMKKPDEALKWLQIAADDGFPCYPFFEIDHHLDNIRKDPDFIAFMSKLKEQWLKYRTEYGQ